MTCIETPLFAWRIEFVELERQSDPVLRTEDCGRCIQIVQAEVGDILGDIIEEESPMCRPGHIRSF